MSSTAGVLYWDIGLLLMVKLENVTYWYRDDSEIVLSSLSLEIGPGEAVCVMGRNGSGKSTLARLVAGLLKPKRGRIAVNGRTFADETPDPDVGILFQNPDNQMIATLVDKEIAFALENQAVPQEKMEEAVLSVAERLGISHLLSRITSELSGGEKQRVALASVMIQRPSVLVLDEPDAFLDENGRRILQRELEQIHKFNPNLVELRITQDPSVAKTYPRLVVIHAGEVIADGSPDEIMNDPEVVSRAALSYTAFKDRMLVLPPALKNLGGDRSQQVAKTKLERTSFAYPRTHGVLEEISLELKSGEVLGLVGPTGVGKSSLGLLICGLLQPTAGAISYLDRSGQPIEKSELRGQVAALLQQPERQFFLDSCSNEIAFGPSNLGRKLTPEEIAGFFAMCGLDPKSFADRDPFTLSAGEKRRLAFAAVLSMTPSVVVFDEPTAGLDQEGVARFLQLAGALRERGIAQLIISHDGDVIRQLADRVLYLKARNQLLELSPPEFFESDKYAGVVSPPAPFSS